MKPYGLKYRICPSGHKTFDKPRDEDRKFCGECGANIQKVKKEWPRCPTCKANIHPTDKFCSNCGGHLDSTYSWPIYLSFP